jgi:membrane dipeptidase
LSADLIPLASFKRMELIVKQIPVIDLHCDSVMNFLIDESILDPQVQVNLPSMRVGGVGAQMFACYVPPSISPGHRFPLVMQMIDKMEQTVATYPVDLMMCHDAAAVRQAIEKKKIAVLLAIENGSAIESQLENIEKFYQRGVRCMTIVHARTHDWAISCGDTQPAFDGLTVFGEKVISVMNELGMIIDVSHAHDRTVERVLALSKRPIVATHSGVAAICPVKRNLNDDLIRRIADNGGMIGINFFNGFLDAEYARITNGRAGDLFAELSRYERAAGDDIIKISQLFGEFMQQYHRAVGDATVPADRVLDHVDYIIKLVGDDFVGFGSDFDGMPHAPVGLENCSGFLLLKQKMLERGYSQATMEKVCYKNFLRVFRAQFV